MGSLGWFEDLVSDNAPEPIPSDPVGFMTFGLSFFGAHPLLLAEIDRMFVRSNFFYKNFQKHS